MDKQPFYLFQNTDAVFYKNIFLFAQSLDKKNRIKKRTFDLKKIFKIKCLSFI